MGIYIKGMEMPKSCMECPLETDYGTCGYYSLYVEAGHESDYEKRRDDCPLIEIPEMHGDLIDRNALVRKFEEIEESIGYAEVPLALAVAGAINDIKKAPTVIEAEEGE